MPSLSATASNITINSSDVIELNGNVVANTVVTVGGTLTALGDINATTGDITVANILTDGYRWANGVLVDFGNGGGGGNYSNSNVEALLPVYGGNLLISNLSLSSDGVILGNNAGAGIGHGGNIVAIGTDAGRGDANSTSTNFYVAIGDSAGSLGTGANSVSIGHNAGYENIGEDSIAIGHNAGNSHGVIPGSNTIAIGTNAGFATQASNSIAIGTNAGYANMANNSILLNATGSNMSSNYSGFFVAPIRQDNPNVTHGVYYNENTNEVLIGVNPHSNGSNGLYSNLEVQAFLDSGTLAGNIIPGGNGVYSLGNATNQWSNLWLKGNTLYMSGIPIGMNGNDQLTVNGNAVPVYDSVGSLTANVVYGNVAQYADYNWANGVPVIANGTFSGNVIAPAVTANAVVANVMTTDTFIGNTVTSNVITNAGQTTTAELVANVSITTDVIFSNTIYNNGNVQTGALRTDNYLYANGMPLTFPGSYSNANVAAYLPTYNGNLNSVNKISTVGNITVGSGSYFIGNGSQLTGLPPTYTNANVAAYLPTYTGGLPAMTGNIATTGNVTAGYFFGNISTATGFPVMYSNSNVAAYLPSYTGTLNDLASVTSVGNVTAAYFVGNGSTLTGMYGNANVSTFLPFYTGNVGASNVNATGNVIAGNVTSNANVSTVNLAVTGKTSLGAVGNVSITGGNVGEVLTTDGTGNVSWATNPVYSVQPVYLVAPIAGNNQMFSNTILASYNSNTDMTVFYNGSLLENTYYTLAGDELTVNIPLQIGDGIDVVRTVAGNVTSIVSSGYGNSNVASYLPLYTGSLPALTGAVTTVGNVSGGNVIGGNIRLTGNTISSTQDTITIDPLNDGTSAGNVVIAGSLQVQGNLTYNAVVNATTTDLLWVAANDASSSSLASGGGLGVGPGGTYAQFTFNSGSNVWQSTLPMVMNGGANLNGALTGATTGVFTGNVTADYFLGNGSQLTGMYDDVNVSAYLSGGTDTAGITTAGDIVANVIFADDSIATTGNVTASYFIGNGSQLTGLPASYTNANVEAYLPLYTGNLGNVANISSSGNVSAQYFSGNGSQLTGMYGNAQVLAYMPGYTGNLTNVDTVTATGNVTAPYFIGNGSQLTGLPAGYTNANVAAFLPTYTGNMSAAYFIGDGSQLTGLPAGYTNADVAAYLPTYTGNLDSVGGITASANITAPFFVGDGTALTGMYSNAIAANYLPVFSGDLGNVANITASGNITAAKLTTTGNISGLNIASTGNLSGNAITGTTVAVTGNVSAANVVATGNITAVNYFGSNVTVNALTSNIANVSGNVNAGNVNVTGRITATNIGNVAALNLNGLETTYLAGDGTWKLSSDGGNGSGMREISKVDQSYGYGVQLMIADGRLFCMKGNGGNQAWTSALGTNQDNPLFAGVDNTYEIPFLDETIGTLVDAGSYGYSAYALFANGNLYTWGYNGYGELGLGNTTYQLFPVLSNTSVAQVYTHPSQASSPDAALCRLVIRKTNNTFWGCGWQGNFQFGLGENSNKLSWTALPWIPTDVLSVWNLGGDRGNMVIQKANGEIWVTGENSSGQLGLGNNNTSTTPVIAPGWLGGDSTMRIKSIGWGGPYADGNYGAVNNMFMFLDNGTTSRLVGAGSNNWGSLGTGNYTNSNVPVAPSTSTGMTGRIAKVLTVGPSVKTVYVLLTNGTLYSWGWNAYGQVGNGNTAGQLVPFALATGVLDIDGAVQGWDYVGYYSQSPYIKKINGYWVCGLNNVGQLGNGNTTQQNSLVRLRVPVGVDFKSFGCYGNNDQVTRFGVSEDDTIWMWGYNGQGNIDPLTAYSVVQPLEFKPASLTLGGGASSSNVTRITGTWTVTAGTNNYSIALPESNQSYSIWVNGSCPNGIILYQATVTIGNNNVPVVGSSYAWNYPDGGQPIKFTSIPAQVFGTPNTIVTAMPGGWTAPTTTFVFGISNTSGADVVVNWGYIKLS